MPWMSYPKISVRKSTKLTQFMKKNSEAGQPSKMLLLAKGGFNMKRYENFKLMSKSLLLPGNH